MEKKAGDLGKTLGENNYELWLAYGKNKRGDFLALTIHNGRNIKRILFSPGVQWKEWWKLVVAVNELAKRPIKPLKAEPRSTKSGSSAPVLNTKHPDSSWNISIKCPHCVTPIPFNVGVGNFQSYAAALRAAGERGIRVGQLDPIMKTGNTDLADQT